MQRAANSPTTNSPSNTSGPPSKRQRLSNGSSQPSSHNSAPAKSTPRNRASDRHAVQAALEEEERKRQAALDRAAADAGETRWVLSFQEEPRRVAEKADGKSAELRVIKKGYAEIDWRSEKACSGAESTVNGEDDVGDKDPQEPNSEEDANNDDSYRTFGDMVGRRSFGRFNKSIERHQNPGYESSSASSKSSAASSSGSEHSEDDKDEDGDGDVDPVGSLIRSAAPASARDERKAKKKAANGVSVDQAASRQDLPVNLGRLSSISAGGGADPRKRTDIECFKCQEKGHKAKDCPGWDRTNYKANEGIGKRRRENF